MTRPGSAEKGKNGTAIRRIWIGRAADPGDGGPIETAEAPETRALLDRMMAWTLEYLRAQGLEVQAGRDGALRTLEFASESDCLEAHERLVAANDQQKDFRLRFVLRPSGVTVLVVS
jgi:hypothetical protein